MSYRFVTDHRSMALDSHRNEAYASALRQVIGPESVVLDLGAGIGIHGLIAAKLGARRVYLVEPEDVLFVAEEIVKANRLEGIVRCLHGRIEDVRLPEPVDVVVSALTGNFLLTEDLLQTLFHARDTVLKPGGVLIPGAATMEAVPVSAGEVHAREIAGWSMPQQKVDLGAARVYASNSVCYRSEGMKDTIPLADPRPLHTVDFLCDRYDGVHVDVAYDITRSGVCHGWLGWFSMKLGDRWLSTSPYEQPMHWSPAFLPLDPPMTFEQGDRVSFALDRAPFGDWSWRVRSGSGCQQHSTFLAAPLSAATLAKAGLDHAPALNGDGRALLHVLSQFDGARSVDAIAQSLSERFPDRHGERDETLAFVQRLVKRYS